MSLDAVDPDAAQRSADTVVDVPAILDAIAVAVEVGLTPVKVNVTVVRDVNDDQVERLVERLSRPDVVVRFIEFMDVGSTNGWRPEQVVSAREITERLSKKWALRPLPPNCRGEVAKRFRLESGAEIGVVASVTEPFCRDCSRARLAANGVFYTCLFAESGLDLRGPLRGGATDRELVSLVRAAWIRRSDRYSEQRQEIVSLGEERQSVEMSRIGG